MEERNFGETFGNCILETQREARREREKVKEGHESILQIQWVFYMAPKRRKDLVLLLWLREEKEREEPGGPWP